MKELFEIPQQLSRRLAWLKKHNLETEKVPFTAEVRAEIGCEYSPWVCRVVKNNPESALYADVEIQGGETEDEAIANWAKKNGLKLWNEESL